MKIAFVISDMNKLELGDCLSHANAFYVYQADKELFYSLKLQSTMSKHNKSKQLSTYLRENGVSIVVALDFGPKAKAFLDEQGIQWHNADKNTSFEDIISIIKKNK